MRLAVDTATGAVAQRLTYDTWGRLVSDTNPGFQPFGYAGGLTDPATGLTRFGVRDYDPTTTQWLSRDTIGFAGGLNHYTYADGDPVNRIDPTGHSAMGCFADILGLLGMVPVVGTVFDIGSALAYAATGDWGAAGLALAGIILPIPASQLKGLARHADEALAFGDETAARLADDVVIVRGGTSDVPSPAEVFSGSYGSTLEEASAAVPHGQIRATTVGQIRSGGGSVVVAPELTRSGVLNEQHVNICLGPGPCPFGDLQPNPVPKSERIQ